MVVRFLNHPRFFVQTPSRLNVAFGLQRRSYNHNYTHTHTHTIVVKEHAVIRPPLPVLCQSTADGCVERSPQRSVAVGLWCENSSMLVLCRSKIRRKKLPVLLLSRNIFRCYAGHHGPVSPTGDCVKGSSEPATRRLSPRSHKRTCTLHVPRQTYINFNFNFNFICFHITDTPSSTDLGVRLTSPVRHMVSSIVRSCPALSHQQPKA